MDNRLTADGQSVFEDAFQFADIARVIVVEQNLHGCLGNGWQGDAAIGAKIAGDMPNQQGQVSPAFLFLGLSNGYWLRAQAAHDTEVAEQPLARY
ncbi:uncharacterized protein Dvar_25110 [Desulfosarcina variabilis str. Montpellier]|uniref:hypothetical protein n=1 Tax=Desulfosarcina variabilis TaxID=2300 RepID=UPI003AFAA260